MQNRASSPSRTQWALVVRAVLLALFAVAAVGVPAGAQVAPTPLQAGPNTGTADSLVGPHVWQFLAQPGRFTVQIDALGMSTAALQMSAAGFSVRAQFASYVKGDSLTLRSVPHGVTIHGVAVRPSRVLVTIFPPNSPLVRDARNYQLEADGDVSFATGGPDIIVGSYMGKGNPYGATRFNANGSIVTSDGENGRWVVFDPQLHVYVVTIGPARLTVKLTPGVGLVDSATGFTAFAPFQ
jgi:hypothetical protein